MKSTMRSGRPVEPQAGGRVVASPYAKELASKMGVDLALVAGTGPEGRITAEDVAQELCLLAGGRVRERVE